MSAAQAQAVACDDESHERVKWTRAWDELAAVGVMDTGEGKLEMRNCRHCGSTLCKPVVEDEPSSGLAIDVQMDATDALAVGQNLRSLARDRRTPLGVREVFTRVGSQMTSAARKAIAQQAKGGAQ